MTDAIHNLECFPRMKYNHKIIAKRYLIVLEKKIYISNYMLRQAWTETERVTLKNKFEIFKTLISSIHFIYTDPHFLERHFFFFNFVANSSIWV